MNYFTSDWHLGEDRIGINGKPNLFYRPFSAVEEQDYHIIHQFSQSPFKDGDTLFHLGDVIYKNSIDIIGGFSHIRSIYPNSKFILIKGNYDTEDKMPTLEAFFDLILDEYYWTHTDYSEKVPRPIRTYYLNHYPVNCRHGQPSITGHIHGLWKVQKNMINVGVDAWHFKPVSETEIDFCYNAMKNHYDENVFPY